MFVTRCDRCKVERGDKAIGWAWLTVRTRPNRDDLHIDLCPACAAFALGSIDAGGVIADEEAGD